MITGVLIARTATQRATSCHLRWYLFILHWIIQSSIHPSCYWFFNSRPALHRTLLMLTGALIERTVTKREMIFHHRWYLWLLHWMIQSLIQLICPRFVNSHWALHITQLTSFKLLQYPIGLLLIRQIPCHRLPSVMEVAIFMDAWLMCLSRHRHNDNII